MVALGGALAPREGARTLRCRLAPRRLHRLPAAGRRMLPRVCLFREASRSAQEVSSYIYINRLLYIANNDLCIGYRVSRIRYVRPAAAG